ncbi:MAG: prepilin-type N-terminal cleavage/methylation domain-containing protein [Polyangiales bacterium]
MVRAGRQEGFTLLELMIVVTIVAVVAALAAPAIASALNARRANEASLDLVRLAKRARSESAAYGRAHLLRVMPAGAGGSSRGRVEAWRGDNNACNTNQWGAIITSDCRTNDACIDQLDLEMDHYDVGSNHVAMALPDFGETIDVCYEPTGVMQWRTGTSGRFSDRQSEFGSSSNDLHGGVRARFEPRDGSGTKNGVARWAVLPLGGDARTLR